jgi:hypothetical protein
VYVLDGATGLLHVQIPMAVDHLTTPAIGDIDGDGYVDVVTALPGDEAPAADRGPLVAFGHDGTVLWQSAGPNISAGQAVALADLDNDGDVEILVGNLVFDHDGGLIATLPDPAYYYGGRATVAADLDDDGDLEIIVGRSAYHHDGTEYYAHPPCDSLNCSPGSFRRSNPQIADFDADPEPEILLTGDDGITMLEHDGTVKFFGLQPIPSNAPNPWRRPAAIHDFNGDGTAGFAVSTGNTYAVYTGDAMPLWTTVVDDWSGAATGTAFDFLGNGVAEAMYADEWNLFIYDGTNGSVLLSAPRSHPTQIEYPVVADVDNDGSAEIIVVSNTYMDQKTAPTVQVIRDELDRWVGARRIWNQHTYHVTNVREDGSIPQFEQPHWKHLNTFRTQAQLEGSSVCQPGPAG